MTIDLDLLRTFITAEAAPTLTAAARLRHVTKSAVSQQLKALEAQLGMPLFERAGRNVRPTAQARALAGTLRHAFALVNDAVDTAREAHGAVRGEVRLGAPRPFTAAVLRPRVAAVLARHPELVLDVTFGTPTRLEAKLSSGELDLAVLVRPSEATNIETREVFVESFEAVASPRYLERHGTPRAAEDFASHRLVVFDRDLPMHLQWWRAAFGSRAVLRGTIVARVGSLDEMRALAEGHVGVTVLPDYFVKSALDRKRLVALTSKRHARSAIALAWRRSAALSARVAAVRDALLEATAR